RPESRTCFAPSLPAEQTAHRFLVARRLRDRPANLPSSHLYSKQRPRRSTVSPIRRHLPKELFLPRSRAAHCGVVNTELFSFFFHRVINMSLAFRFHRGSKTRSSAAA